MTAPAFKSVVTVESSGQNLVFNKPAGLAKGDIMYCALTNEGGQVPTGPAGWTLESSNNTTATRYSAVFSRVVTDPTTEAATYSFNQNFPFSGKGELIVYSNGLTDVVGKTALSNSANITCPSVNTNGPERTIIHFYFSFHQGAGDTITTPAGDTSRYFGAGTSQTHRICDYVVASAGASGAKTAVCSGVYDTVGYTVAIKPSAVKVNSVGILTS